MATVDDLVFTLSSDGTYYSVKAANTSISGDLEIPDTYNELPVKTIDTEGFKSCTKLTSAVIPSSVTSINTYAFYGCSGLLSLSLSLMASQALETGYLVIALV